MPGDFKPVYNPGVIEKYRGSYEVKKSFPFESDEWYANLSKFRCKVQDTDFHAYGQQIEILAHRATDAKSHVCLGPLRGASKPCVLAEVMSRGELQYDFFDYQRGSDPASRPAVISRLKPILIARDPNQELYRINVTDTVKGGYGINALVSIMKEIKEGTAAFQNQSWMLDLHLLHGEQVDFDNINEVLKAGDGRFGISIHPYKVPNLIFEDYDPALAFEIASDHGRFLFKPCAQPGKMLLREGNEVFVVETDNTNLMLEEFSAEGITANFLTSADHAQSGAVWTDYQNKS